MSFFLLKAARHEVDQMRSCFATVNEKYKVLFFRKKKLFQIEWETYTIFFF